MTQGKTVIVYNPQAGKLNRGGEISLGRAAEILARAGRHPVLTPTSGPGAAGDLARQAVEQGAAMVVVAGGDGTINEALQGLAGSAVPLAILPAGTANVLANEMGLPAGIETAARELQACVPHRISVGRVRFPVADTPPRWFLLMAGAGLDARVVYRVSAPLKARLGKIAYWIAAFGMVGQTLEEFEVQVEGRSCKCSFALVSKVRNYGGDLEIAHDTSLLDDRFEVVLFSGRNALRYVKYLGAVALKRLSGISGVTVLRAREVALPAAAGRGIYVQVDGEFAGRLPASIELVPGALTLLVPPAYVRRVQGDA